MLHSAWLCHISLALWRDLKNTSHYENIITNVIKNKKYYYKIINNSLVYFCFNIIIKNNNI